jgi:hypothetical protein
MASLRNALDQLKPSGMTSREVRAWIERHGLARKEVGEALGVYYRCGCVPQGPVVDPRSIALLCEKIDELSDSQRSPNDSP